MLTRGDFLGMASAACTDWPAAPFAPGNGGATAARFSDGPPPADDGGGGLFCAGCEAKAGVPPGSCASKLAPSEESFLMPPFGVAKLRPGCELST